MQRNPLRNSWHFTYFIILQWFNHGYSRAELSNSAGEKRNRGRMITSLNGNQFLGSTLKNQEFKNSKVQRNAMRNSWHFVYFIILQRLNHGYSSKLSWAIQQARRARTENKGLPAIAGINCWTWGVPKLYLEGRTEGFGFGSKLKWNKHPATFELWVL